MQARNYFAITPSIERDCNCLFPNVQYLNASVHILLEDSKFISNTHTVKGICPPVKHSLDGKLNKPEEKNKQTHAPSSWGDLSISPILAHRPCSCNFNEAKEIHGHFSLSDGHYWFSQQSLNPPQDTITKCSYHVKVGFSFINWTVIPIERLWFLSLNPLRNKERAFHFSEQLTQSPQGLLHLAWPSLAPWKHARF